jgi:hypothetical protein
LTLRRSWQPGEAEDAAAAEAATAAAAALIHPPLRHQPKLSQLSMALPQPPLLLPSRTDEALLPLLLPLSTPLSRCSRQWQPPARHQPLAPPTAAGSASAPRLRPPLLARCSTEPYCPCLLALCCSRTQRRTLLLLIILLALLSLPCLALRLPLRLPLPLPQSLPHLRLLLLLALHPTSLPSPHSAGQQRAQHQHCLQQQRDPQPTAPLAAALEASCGCLTRPPPHRHHQRTAGADGPAAVAGISR